MSLKLVLSSDAKTLTVTSPTSLEVEQATDGSLTITSVPGSGLVHPGSIVSKPMLDFTAGKLAVSEAPWAGEFTKLRNARDANRAMNYSSLSWVPRPWEYVGRGPNGTPSEGDKDELADSKAAYIHALLYSYTGDRVHALKAIEILNAWTIIQDHKFDLTTYSDGKLIAGWTGTMFARAAEIIRYTFESAESEPKLDVEGLIAAFKRAWWPRVSDGHNGGGANWLAAFADTMIQIAVFCDDVEMLNQGEAYLDSIIPSIFYMVGDKNPYAWGAGLPLPPPRTMYDSPNMTAAKFKVYWRSPSKFVSGLQGETGRDVWHMAMGYAAVFNGLETLYLQGRDLYTKHRDRLVASLELQANWMYQVWKGVNPPAGWVFPVKMNWLTTATHRTTFEIAWHHFAQRLGIGLPHLEKLLKEWGRTTSYRVDVNVAFEMLTHYGTP